MEYHLSLTRRLLAVGLFALLALLVLLFALGFELGRSVSAAAVIVPAARPAVPAADAGAAAATSAPARPAGEAP